MVFLTNINLSQNELQNAIIQPLATAPSNPKLGQIYTNSITSRIMWYNGTDWKVVGVVVESSETNGKIKVDGVEMTVYELPIASSNVVGGIKVGENLTITSDGKLSSTDTKVTNMNSNSGKVVTGLNDNTTLQTTDVKNLTLNGITPVDGGYVTDGATLANAISALDFAVKNAVSGGGEVNQNAFSNVKVGDKTIAADSKTDTLEIVAGANITIEADESTDKITIKGAYVDATELTSGLMSPADKAKLNNIETGAQKNVQSDWNAVSGDALILNKPTNLSAFTNDEGFINNTVNNLVNYYTKSDTFTKTEVNNLLSAIHQMDVQKVDSLPTTDISSTTIYLVPKIGTTNDAYDEYIYVESTSKWEMIGNTIIDLTNYLEKNGDASNVTLGGSDTLKTIVEGIINQLNGLNNVQYSTATISTTETSKSIDVGSGHAILNTTVIDSSTNEEVFCDVKYGDANRQSVTVSVSTAPTASLNIVVAHI